MVEFADIGHATTIGESAQRKNASRLPPLADLFWQGSFFRISFSTRGLYLMFTALFYEVSGLSNWPPAQTVARILLNGRAGCGVSFCLDANIEVLIQKPARPPESDGTRR